MKTKLVSTLILALVVLTNCSKSSEEPKSVDPEIIGTWKKAGYISNISESGELEILSSPDQKETSTTVEFKANGNFLKTKKGSKNNLIESSDGKWTTVVVNNHKNFHAVHKKRNGLLEGGCYDSNEKEYAENYHQYNSKYLIIVYNDPACDGVVSVYEKK